MTTPAERIARVRARVAEQVQEAERFLSANPSPTTAELVDVTINTFRKAAGPDARLPLPLSSLRNRQEVERMSLEGKKVSEISEALGICYGYVVDLRREMGVSKPRKRR